MRSGRPVEALTRERRRSPRTPTGTRHRSYIRGADCTYSWRQVSRLPPAPPPFTRRLHTHRVCICREGRGHRIEAGPRSPRHSEMRAQDAQAQCRQPSAGYRTLSMQCIDGIRRLRSHAPIVCYEDVFADPSTGVAASAEHLSVPVNGFSSRDLGTSSIDKYAETLS